MVLLLDFSRGVWVRYFMQSWFLLVPTPQPPALCHLCLHCPFQSYLVSGGPSGSMSHPPPPGPRMPLPWPPCCLGEYNACIERHRVHRAFSLSELLHGWAYKLIGAAMVRHFCSGVLSTWRPSVHASAETAGIRGWFPFRLTALILLYMGLKNLLKYHSSKAQFFGIHRFLWSRYHICTWLLEKQYLWYYRTL